MFIPDPDFLPIPDPVSDPGSKNLNKNEEWEKISWDTFFVATNFTELNFLPKNLSLSSKNMGLGSGINLFRIPDPGPGIKKAPDPWSGSATLKNTY